MPAHPAETSGQPSAPRTYIRKTQQYEDLKSSATAFFLVSALLLLTALLCRTGLIRLPAAPGPRLLIQLTLTLTGIATLAIAAAFTRSAKTLAPQAAQETQATQELIQWFLTNHTAQTLDLQLTQEAPVQDLTPEEQTLKRLELIQDIYTINFDITEEGYTDILSEETYSKIYE